MRSSMLWAVLCSLASTAISGDMPATLPARPVDFEVGQIRSTSGKVICVTKDAIMITQDRKQPVIYLLHDRLASGTVHKKVVEATSYKVSDVKVGDLVNLGLIEENKQSFCVDITIHERPGGEIPAGQIVNKEQPWYQWQNAQIAFRDKGIPIPEHLIPKTPPPPKETKDPPKK